MFLLFLTLCLIITNSVCFYILIDKSKKSQLDIKNINLCTIAQETKQELLVQTPMFTSSAILLFLNYNFSQNIKLEPYLLSIYLFGWFMVSLCFFLLGISISFNGTRYHAFSGYLLVSVFISMGYVYFFILRGDNLYAGNIGIIAITVFVLGLLIWLYKDKFVVKLGVQLYLIAGFCFFMVGCLLNYYLL